VNVALWVVAGLLSAVLLISTSKMFVPRERIASVGRAAEWVLDFSPGALRAIGALEILAAVGLILPAVLDVAPVMVPVTAVCVAALFTGAVLMRLRRGERTTVVPDLVYLALAVFVAWGRFGPEPFTG
jgi:hypothetical protein